MLTERGRKSAERCQTRISAAGKIQTEEEEVVSTKASHRFHQWENKLTLFITLMKKKIAEEESKAPL